MRGRQGLPMSRSTSLIHNAKTAKKLVQEKYREIKRKNDENRKKKNFRLNPYLENRNKLTYQT